MVVDETFPNWLDGGGSTRSDSFLVVATPGAGKTRLAVALVQSLFAKGEVRAAVVLVPTLGLLDQWAQAFEENGIRATTSDRGGAVYEEALTAKPKSPYPRIQVFCCTYQALQHSVTGILGSVGRLDAHADRKHRVALILDEVHHASSDRSWGEAVQALELGAFGPVISLSGTPFRTDKERIIGVPYDMTRTEAGKLTAVTDPHVHYSFHDGRRDEIVRSVDIFTATGKVVVDGEEVEIADFDLPADETSTNLSERDRRALRSARMEGSGIAKRMIYEGIGRLESMREEYPDATGLALAESIDHARWIGKQLTSCGVQHVKVVTAADGDESQERLRRFARSAPGGAWLVAVQMASEGFDAAHLSVLVYLASAYTRLFLEQSVGRIIRKNGPDDRRLAVAVVPGHPMLDRITQTYGSGIGGMREDATDEPIDEITSATTRPAACRYEGVEPAKEGTISGHFALGQEQRVIDDSPVPYPTPSAPIKPVDPTEPASEEVSELTLGKRRATHNTAISGHLARSSPG